MNHYRIRTLFPYLVRLNCDGDLKGKLSLKVFLRNVEIAAVKGIP